MDFKKEISKCSKEALIETLDKLIGIDEKGFLRDCIRVEQKLILEKMKKVSKKRKEIDSESNINIIMNLMKHNNKIEDEYLNLRKRYEKLSEELRNI
ncbi:hypothetical protein [Clostridium baratii]|uniref:hypothetical protein n=1 Tax=Clostridium baratii TaxID=1561 RepID=UPI0030CE8A60